MSFDANCLATAIGSVPFISADDAYENILENFPNIPFWPQLPRLRRSEEMNFQYLDSFPGLSSAKEKLIVDTDSLETALEMEDFYSNVAKVNLEYFGIKEKSSVGLWSMNEHLRGSMNMMAVKGQLLGPISLGLQATDQNLKSLIYNDIFRDVILTDIQYKAKWLELKLREICPDTIIFFDEPYLSFVDSAFCSLPKSYVKAWLSQCMGLLEGKKGIHCCSNTDWGFLTGLDIDIISLDAYQYGDKFLLFGDNIYEFIKRGGMIAWGIVPTSEEDIMNENVESLYERFERLIAGLESRGIQTKKVLSRSLITPSCGLGSSSVDTCRKAHTLTRELSHIIRERYGFI
ncbi:MAG: hypothetical protein QF682_04690 [Candidatus Thermoplasmatota archaeon]|nr:hypothetical protein [Candidatus Thermoplasmatota archaeon]